MPRPSLVAILYCSALPCAAALEAQGGGVRHPPSEIAAVHIAHPPDIDGNLDDPIWQELPPITAFWKMRPVDNEPASERTEAWVAYDEKYLYVAFRAYDRQPDQVRASLAPRDQIFDDDVIGVFLDTFHDGRRGDIFWVNPLGIQGDEVAVQGQPDDFTIDFIWKSAARRTPDGFTAELAIPFRSLRFRNVPVQDWGIAFIRIIQHKTEQDIWPRVDMNTNCLLCQAATLRGLTGIRPGRTIELLPTVTGHEAGARADSTQPFQTGPVVGAVGLGVQLGLAANLTANAAFNPDFSQVESDAGQVTVNQRFALFYPEKRPFFLEGQDIFVTPIQLVYTRTIFQPSAAVKLTGKEGGTTVGVLASADRSPILPAGDTLPSGTTFPGAHAYVNLVRLKHDLGPSSSLGVLATDREFAGTHNRVAAVDGVVTFLRHWTGVFQGGYSDTRNLDQRREHAPALRLDLVRTSLHSVLELFYQDLGRAFRGDAGFLQRVDIRERAVYAAYQARPNGRALLYWSPTVFYDRIFDHTGTLTDEKIRPQLQLQFARQTWVTLAYWNILERFSGVPFYRNRYSVDVQTAPSKAVNGEVMVEQGSAVEYDSVYLGYSRDVRVTAALRPNDAFRFDGSLIKETFWRRAGGPRAYDINIWRGKATWQFSTALFVRAIGQWNTLSRKLDLNALFSYTVNPETVFFFGVDNGLDGPVGSTLRTSSRTVFLKASYLWQL